MRRGTTKTEAVLVGAVVDPGVPWSHFLEAAAGLEAGLRASVRRWQKEERISGAGFDDIVGLEGRQRGARERARHVRHGGQMFGGGKVLQSTRDDN